MNVLSLMLSQVDAGNAVAALPVVLPATPSDGDVFGWATTIYNAVQTKQWGSMVFFVVTLATWLTRRYLGPKMPFISSKLGGALLTFFWAFAGMLTTVWTAKLTPTGADIWKAVSAAFIASGGWSLVTNLIEHAAVEFKWGWAQSVLDFLKPPKTEIAPVAPAAPAP